MPGEGKEAGIPHASDLARRDVPTCRITDRAGEVETRLQAESRDVCVVVNDQRVVLGLVKREALASDPQAPVEEVMQSGPTTLRPNWSLDKLVNYMQQQQIESILVTTSDGELMGILYRSDAERRVNEFELSSARKA